MQENSRYDAWAAGNNYDLYMGRWSRQIAPKFLDWLQPHEDIDWLEVGCGTGALSGEIVSRCNPRTLSAIDSSEGFLAQARQNIPDERVAFQVGDAQKLDVQSESRDIVVSALVLNFVSDRQKALAEMKRVARPGGTIAFYVWDYPGGGVEFMRAFWTAATSLDPAALDLTEDKRFPFCTPEALTKSARSAGLTNVEWAALEAPSTFQDFEDYWHPFTLGAGPAPGYCANLAPDARQRLEQKLRDSLPYSADKSIPMKLRAWAVKAKP